MGRVSLQELVTSVANRLMAIDAPSLIPETEEVLETLRGYFEVDHACLRYNDHGIRASIMIAEMPRRDVVPDPDPMAVVYFYDADEVFEQLEHSLTPVIARPHDETAARYQAAVREVARLAWGEEAVAAVIGASVLATPLVSGSRPTGFISLTTFGDRAFDAAEIAAMRAIAAMFAQLKGRIEAENHVRHHALHDDLTGLSNRRALIEYMEERLQPGQPGPVAALYIDLDRLKALNDFLGHTAGDQFIQALAKRLRDQTDPRDMIARLGGDEFVIVPSLSMSSARAEKEADRIRQLVSERVSLGVEKVSRTVSVGVAVGIPGESSVSDVLRQADQAVMAAKGAGGNGIAVFTEEMRAFYALRDDIELNLRHAVESDALLLHYQPEVDLRTGEILAVEALVRWQHPTRGLLLPGTFIEVAEATNLAGELGRWVIRAACKQFAEWKSHGLAGDLVMRINVSPVQLVSLDFVASVATVLMEFGLAGSSICLEITEHVVVQDMVRTRITLEGLRKIGVAVAIDDFGTGYSSLSHLKALTVSALKVDQGFVRRLGHDDNDGAIVKSIVGLADSFGLDLVAEGVETEIAARTLLELGCYRAQGFLLSRPVPPEAIAKLLSAGGKIALPFLDRRSERVQ
ncbi:putative bifunctional diguanylate cyclase/phosphodiesterase [Antrihabitans stalactiti]|uniref:Bifunctional diguanylate cyclase/phosphodiesterase n=1 Tax=Antrihabitans stalactiti TaxID=2584121 RepID=A0A848KAD9_9NOCA|nr:bifunctional diguanylate cyclase/phosphodiesterase [Antrihabitans stalactiti]NMN95299.1 bifunctional diguanylate cyclase/phosphodiesterase [Antrihabitans stalactiti]